MVGQYHRADTPTVASDNWFHTGDVASIDPLGFMRITDRSKDVIKSGGEWISSINLENLAMGHQQVRALMLLLLLLFLLIIYIIP